VPPAVVQRPNRSLLRQLLQRAGRALRIQRTAVVFTGWRNELKLVRHIRAYGLPRTAQRSGLADGRL
jgi:hypothetical protein